MKTFALPEPVAPYGWVSKHTTPGPFEWQFHKDQRTVYWDTAVFVIPVYERPPAPAAQAEQPACKGPNCTAVAGVNHSPECQEEHSRLLDAGLLDTAGNRHPEYRYAGYSGEALAAEASADQAAAYAEGQRARAPEQPAQGWKLVPMEPTPDMLVQGALALDKASGGDFDADPHELSEPYAAMLAAAPQPKEGA